MDIARYIGLFLVENEYCYLPGLGTLQVVKKAAKYDDDKKVMSGPEYTVEFRQGFGSIDDSFAYFISNNERVSIAHASNFLKDFCAETKEKLKAGEEVVLPAIGRLHAESDDKIAFEPDAHISVKGKPIPMFRISDALHERETRDLTKIIENTEIKEPKGDEEIVLSPPKVNWAKIIVLALVVIAVLVLAIYFFSHLSKRDKERTTTQPQTTHVKQPAAIPATVAPKPTDSSLNTTPPTVDTQVAQQQPAYFMVAINQYNNLQSAESRVAKLNSFGHHTEVWTKDSTTFFVVIKMPETTDKQHVVDSLRIFYNPTGDVKIVP